MGARTKLNRAYLNGSVLAAAAVGVLTGSWWAFALVLAALVAANVWAGEIRTRSGR